MFRQIFADSLVLDVEMHTRLLVDDHDPLPLSKEFDEKALTSDNLVAEYDDPKLNLLSVSELFESRGAEYLISVSELFESRGGRPKS